MFDARTSRSVYRCDLMAVGISKGNWANRESRDPAIGVVRGRGFRPCSPRLGVRCHNYSRDPLP